MARRKGAAGAALFLAVAIAAAPTSRLAGEVDAKALRDLVRRRQGHVVLVNFWATWCVPCREEFPELVKLQKNLGPKGLQILGVSTDFAKEMPDVEKFLAQQKPGFPNYHKRAGSDDQEFINAVDTGWGGELPFSVLYDRSGRKIKTLSGKHSYADYEREVSAALQEHAAAGSDGLISPKVSAIAAAADALSAAVHPIPMLRGPRLRSRAGAGSRISS